ncbi:hypothetical protein PANO111632_14655 [Paracoccus nototheniae]|uniref:Tetratricopeptide repeat protein n=1 Tax=Paracoccus nototheniae TaxID=2489002 RepID=A0ABW4E324_9RHOB|nr:hypothetical protein [Paracoccus nototheniae]
MTRSAALALAALIALAGGMAQAQTAPDPEELLALTFYYQQQDQASIRSELQRLQVRYPGWQPPEDLARLTQDGPGPEIDTIFRQIGAGQFDQARATIDATRTAFPDWTPPDEMMALLDTNEGQGLLDAALNANDLERALALAGERPGLLRCDRVNNAWRIAEAQQAAGQTPEALGTFRAVLGACVNPPDIIATLEKASAIASVEDMQVMFAQAMARFPDMVQTLQPVQARLTGSDAAGAAEAPATATATAAPAPSAAATAAPTPAPAPAATATPAPVPAPAPAATAAPAPAPQAAPAQQAAPAPSGGGGSANAIYQQAWQTYNLDRPMEAVAQFDAALRGRLDPTQRRDAQYGMALAYLKMGMPDNASRIAAATDLTRTQRVDVERQILDQRGVAAYNRRDYRRAIEFFDAIEGLTGSLRRDLAVLRAYAYLNSNQRDRARREFTRLHNELATTETRRGLAALQ